MPDVLIVYYRKDLFCNEKEQAAYQEKYGKKLPCDPAEMDDVDWDQVKTFGEFFRRAKGEQLAGQALDDDFYGIAYQAGKGYDFSIMQVNAFIWQHGADIWDETKAPEGQAEGVVNSAKAVEALEHYLSLQRVHAAGGQDRDHGHLQGRRAVPRGQGRLDHPVDRLRRERDHARRPRRSPTRSRSPSHPGMREADGKISRWANIGGQPFVLTTWNGDEMVGEMRSTS